MAVIGIDLGTTACKACAYDNEGNLIAKTRAEYSIISKQNGWAEIDPIELKNSIFKSVKDIASIIDEAIFAISFSSQGEGIVPLDSKYNPVGNIILSYDNRCVEQADRIDNFFGNKNFYDITGQLLSSSVSAAKILWVMENLDEYEKVPEKFCCVGDYAISCFGLEPVIDYSLASRTGCFNVLSLKWQNEILEAIHINSSMLSQVKQAGTIAGYIEENLSNSLNLGENIAIVVGGHDQPCGQLGICRDETDKCYYSLGTTETCVCTMDSFMPELYSMGMPCYPHVVQGKYVTLPGNYTGGIILDWYRKQHDNDNVRLTYDEIIEDMSDTPSDILVLPHFTCTGSPYNDDKSAGAIIGLKLSSTKNKISRALIEGVTMEIKLNIELLKSIGIDINGFLAAGAITKYDKIMKIKADILGKAISVSQISEAAAMGAGILAANGIGEKICINKNNVDNLRTYYPDTNNKKYYNGQFEKYKRIYNYVKKIIE
ncbi:MAG: FGGY-family carbohydrate kinase [Eubacteriales bacterium]|nr:FGGY-family carbohydrate kinase [Eubacteriales bacterium]